ncbi:MAG: hypothetical protein KF914_16885 [Rhizobiaceae bacterium]|nr:hypothetical protein [Rhizobiaceae bacterium]
MFHALWTCKQAPHGLPPDWLCGSVECCPETRAEIMGTSLIERAERLEDRREFAAAATGYVKVIRAGNSDPEVRVRLARCLRLAGNLDRAIHHYQTALLHPEARSEWHLALATCLLEAGHTDAAARNFLLARGGRLTGRVALDAGCAGIDKGVKAFASDPDHRAGRALEAYLAGGGERDDDEALGFLMELAQTGRESHVFWLYCFARLARLGRLRLAWQCKRLAAAACLDACWRSPPADGAGLETAVAAACYIGEYRAAHGLVAAYRELAPASDNPWRDGGRAEADLLLSEGRLEEARDLCRRLAHSRPLSAFRELTAGKSVAVVGPAVNELANGDAIDRFDLVARTNFRGKAVLADHAAMTGRRTDIAYYNTIFVDGHAEDIGTELHDGGLSFVVTRHLSTSRRLKAMIGEAVPIRKWLSFKKLDFVGIGFAMRHIAFDLVLNTDRPVTLFGIDFFLGRQPHYAGYFEPGIDLNLEIARHDVFDTFIFLRRLWQAGAIKGDAIVEELLSDTPEAFARRMERRLRAAPDP